MFSRIEREYLQELVRHPADPVVIGGRSITEGYQRKLRWTIRQKVARGTPDWELYVSAAERDPRVRVTAPTVGPDMEPVPLYTDPFVRIVRGARDAILGSGHGSRKSPPKSEDGR